MYLVSTCPPLVSIPYHLFLWSHVTSGPRSVEHVHELLSKLNVLVIAEKGRVEHVKGL